MRLEDGMGLSAMRWLTDVLFNAPVAVIPGVYRAKRRGPSACSAGNKATGSIFSFAEFAPFLKRSMTSSASDKLEGVQRSRLSKRHPESAERLSLYQRLKNSIQPRVQKNFTAELQSFASSVRCDGSAPTLDGRKFRQSEPR